MISEPSDRESKSNSNDEVFRAYVTDSQDSLERPEGQFKDLFKKKGGKVNKGRNGNSSNGSQPPKRKIPTRLTSKQVE